MSYSKTTSIAILPLLLFIVTGCSARPVPSEVMESGLLEKKLWRAGAGIYIPQEYKEYRASIRRANDLLIKENSKPAWFRNYGHVKDEFYAIMTEGEELYKKLKLSKEQKATVLQGQISYLETLVGKLRETTSLINGGRASRKYITSAELSLKEARVLFHRTQYLKAEERLRTASSDINKARRILYSVASRYTDSNQIRRWQSWVDETISETGESGGYAIIVSKADSVLMLYRNGKLLRLYPVGIGFNGSNDKLHAGDRATPEGRYFIIKKNHNSRYHKALLINYPNDEDRRQFALARKNGIIRRNAGIGGLIEIHGGGTGGMTYGCISLENKDMDELFNAVDAGTPVTIVGAIESENRVSSVIRDLL